MNQDLFRDAPITHHPNSNAAGAVAYPQLPYKGFDPQASAEAVRAISAWRDYQPTPLVRLDALAKSCGVGAIHYKDESSRFGLGSFKALGGAYAVQWLLQCELGVDAAELENGAHRKRAAGITVVTATDGNHGRSVAWGAARFGCACRIYIHAGVSEQRAQSMRAFGAEVIRIRGNYDESVRIAAADAAAHGYHVVSDTSYPGYAELPSKVMAGYSVMIEEILQQLPSGARLTHLFVQGGVGGLAAAVAARLWQHFGAARPRCIVVEPKLADCLLQSARCDRPTEVAITRETIMAGLSCGAVSQLAWPVLAAAADDFLAIPDDLVAPLMRHLAHGTPSIEAGESAVAGLAGCLAACSRDALKSKLALDVDSQVLVLGTEGATDRGIYDEIVNCGSS